jgi:hypothetical protein
MTTGQSTLFVTVADLEGMPFSKKPKIESQHQKTSKAVHKMDKKEDTFVTNTEQTMLMESFLHARLV